MRLVATATAAADFETLSLSSIQELYEIHAIPIFACNVKEIGIFRYRYSIQDIRTFRTPLRFGVEIA
jgi:hypothetical protein